MNTDEFLATINRQAPEHLPRADREFLRRQEVILGSGPYYREHIRKAIHLLGLEYEFLGKTKREPSKSTEVCEVRPQVAISQIIVIHNLNPDQCRRIRLGLIQTGLINFEGPVFVNFSPFTGRTIDSIPPDAFDEADYHMEYSIFDRVAAEGKRKPLGYTINPVFFTRSVEPTLVQLVFVLGGQRQPGIGPEPPLPHPLYRAFLNVNSDYAQAVMDFMNTYKVYLFPACWEQKQLENYARGTEKSMELTLIATEDQLKAFWSAEQQKMRTVLKAAQGRPGQVVFPPIFPVCEEAIVEWGAISGYFDAESVQTQVPENVRLVLFEFKEANTSEATVRVRRYYGWLSYMWAELADDICKGKAALICQSCGRLISPSTRGKRKRFCSLAENPECYKARKRKYVYTSRRKQLG